MTPVHVMRFKKPRMLLSKIFSSSFSMLHVLLLKSKKINNTNVNICDISNQITYFVTPTSFSIGLPLDGPMLEPTLCWHNLVSSGHSILQG